MTYFVDTQQTTSDAQVQRLQDDAYTLAYYLLGNDDLAETATEAVFASFGSASSAYDRLRVDVFRRVLARCRHGGIPVSGRYDAGDIGGLLQTIELQERSAVVLVDVLGCSYDEAARVLDRPRKHIMWLLAQARLHLAA